MPSKYRNQGLDGYGNSTIQQFLDNVQTVDDCYKALAISVVMKAAVDYKEWQIKKYFAERGSYPKAKYKAKVMRYFYNLTKWAYFCRKNGDMENYETLLWRMEKVANRYNYKRMRTVIEWFDNGGFLRGLESARKAAMDFDFRRDEIKQIIDGTCAAYENCEAFFHSDLFTLYAGEGIDPEVVITRCREAAEKEISKAEKSRKRTAKIARGEW